MRSPIFPDCPFEPEIKLIAAIGLRPGAAFDVGANTGIYSTMLENVVGSDRLYLFEPLPELHENLLRRFGKAHVLRYALSSRTGTQEIRVPFIDGKRFDTRASLNGHSERNETSAELVSVELKPLDQVAAELDIGEIAFIKIDVEGHEIDVLEGAVKTIERCRPLLLVEIEARHHAFPIDRIFSRLEGFGYRGYYVRPASFELLEVGRFQGDRDQKQEDLDARRYLDYLNNFFFVHRDDEPAFVTKVHAFLASERALGSRARKAE